MQRILLSHIALFIANAIYAVNYIFAKDVMPDYISPTGFILLRVIGASIIFSIIHLLFIREVIKKKDFLYIIICAVFGVVVNMLCFFEGLNLTTPINASVIMITTPLIVYLISCFFSTEEPTKKRLAGVCLGLGGAIALITAGNNFEVDINLGNLLVFLNAVSYALYLVLIKTMMNKYHPITILTTIFLIGCVIILPIGFSHISDVNFSSLPMPIIFKGLFVIIFTTCVAYFLNIYAIGRLRPSIVAFYIYLQPLLATAISLSLDREQPHAIQLIAAINIFIGLYFVIKRNKI